MPAQSIHIAKILGATGEAIRQKFSEWAGLRESDDPSGRGGHQWPVPAKLEMDRFVEALRENRCDPTIAYSDEFSDLWSSPPTRWLAEFPALVEVQSDRHELACYTLPDDDRLQKTLEVLRHRRSVHPEDRWFAAHTLEAIRAGDPCHIKASLVFIRTVLGPLVEDSEIEQAVARPSEWIVALTLSAR